MDHMTKESSSGTVYNVAASLADWATARIDAWTPEQRQAIEDDFTRRIREQHGQRFPARRAQNVHNQ